MPSFPDNEKSFPELQARVARTIAFLKSVKPAQFADAAGRDIQLQMRMGSIGFDGESYLLGWALPNFYFHVTTAYNILRHCGVDLVKQDFPGTSKQLLESQSLQGRVAGATSRRLCEQGSPPRCGRSFRS